MAQESKSITILMADDDPDDQLLCAKALKESSPNTKLEFVDDGQQLIEYLKKNSDTADADSKQPAIVLLDLNMPKKDGREALKEIKSDPLLRKIPIIVFSTSKSDSDVDTTYDLGVNSFITKPLTYKGFVDVMSVLSKYWFETAQLPNH